MIHHSCDRCRRIISQEEIRYEVRIEISALVQTNEDHHLIDGDRDYLAELDDLLQDEIAEEGELFGNGSAEHSRRYDLCAECHASYLRNPLSIETQLQLGFSNN